MNDICDWVNPNCIVKAHCSKRCILVNNEICNRVLEFKNYVGHDYDRVYNEMLENMCCPICGDDMFYDTTLDAKTHLLDCVSCLSGITLKRFNIFDNSFIKRYTKYQLIEIFWRETFRSNKHKKIQTLEEIFIELNIDYKGVYNNAKENINKQKDI